MAKMRNAEKLNNRECPVDFSSQPKSLSMYQSVDVELLVEACANFREITSNPIKLLINANDLIQATYFSVDELKKALESVDGAYMRLYYGVLKDGGRHFMFMAPANRQGNAIDGADVLFAECIGENPPCDKPTGTEKDKFMCD